LNAFDLHERTALVTGAASGLGRSFALALASAGAFVYCADKNLEGAEETAASIRSSDGQACGIRTDVTSDASVTAMADSITGSRAQVDILVNNAGIATVPARTHEVSIEDWDQLMRVNLRGTFVVTRSILPIMLRGGRGTIINIASVIGLIGVYPGFAMTGVPYAASKAAVIGFTRQLAIEYADQGIRANVIAPGWHGGTKLGQARRATATPEIVSQFERHILDSVPMGRRGRPEEMDGLIVYLASDASAYVTGQTFVHDGGLTSA
jgi:NAD(P)-dependent dehydrogenase (short-subunit alcohol dehydrogenase family)